MAVGLCKKAASDYSAGLTDSGIWQSVGSSPGFAKGQGFCQAREQAGRWLR
ncbi:hypothetical protein QUF72_08150 [Desulfobacterales bacterium HSG2]|nr:hypothetical protein [Desulfobacterales bacterium HSG2]